MLVALTSSCAGDDAGPPETAAAVTATPAPSAAPGTVTREPTVASSGSSLPAPPQAPGAAPIPPGQPATIVNVVDGDTVDVMLNGEQKRVRLILIDTPEVFGGEECYGRAASDFTKSLLKAQAPVHLEKDVSETDRFDRLLRYVYLDDGRMVNEVIVSEGFATLATYPPDVKYVERIRAAERSAREAGRGLWSACQGAPVPTAVAPPPGQPAPVPPPAATTCDPSYPTICVPPPPPDLDCGDIPFRRFQVLPPDPHRFDGSDNDGLGCESG